MGSNDETIGFALGNLCVVFVAIIIAQTFYLFHLLRYRERFYNLMYAMQGKAGLVTLNSLETAIFPNRKVRSTDFITMLSHRKYAAGNPLPSRYDPHREAALRQYRMTENAHADLKANKLAEKVLLKRKQDLQSRSSDQSAFDLINQSRRFTGGRGEGERIFEGSATLDE